MFLSESFTPSAWYPSTRRDYDQLKRILELPTDPGEGVGVGVGGVTPVGGGV
jgi:hypothetical protein